MLWRTKGLIGSAIMVAALQAPLSAHADTIYDWTWSGGENVSASGTLDVLNGYVQSVTGTISGSTLGTTGSLSLITASSPGVISNPDPANSTPGSFVYQDGNGDDFEGDAAFSSANPWVDYYGLVLAVSGTGLGTGNSGESNYAFNLWSNGPDSWSASLGGNGGAPEQVDAFNQPGTFTVSPVPLPTGLPMLLGGLALIGWATRRRSQLTNLFTHAAC